MNSFFMKYLEYHILYFWAFSLSYLLRFPQRWVSLQDSAGHWWDLNILCCFIDNFRYSRCDTCRTDKAVALLVEDDKSISYLIFNFLVINLPGTVLETRCHYLWSRDQPCHQPNKLREIDLTVSILVNLTDHLLNTHILSWLESWASPALPPLLDSSLNFS